MYGGMCPKCLRDLTDGVCLYCSSMQALANEMAADTFRIRIPEDSIPAATVPVSAPAAGNGRREAPAPATDAVQPIAVSCSFDEEILTNTSLNPIVARLEFTNTGGRAPATVRLSLDGLTVSVQSFFINPDRSRMDMHLSSSLLKSLDTTYRAITVSVAVGGREISRQTSTVKVRAMNDLLLGDHVRQVVRWITPSAKAIRSLLAGDGPVMREMQAISDSDIRDLKIKALDRAVSELERNAINPYRGKRPDIVLGNVILQMFSVYNALLSIGIKYVNMTVSEGSGLNDYQRVNLPSETIREKRGVCIDLSCLFASVFEACGLMPVIVFPKGHAMAGVMVSSSRMKRFSEMDYSDCEYVTKIRINDIGDGTPDDIQVVLLECTLIGSRAPFLESLKEAVRIFEADRVHIEGNNEVTVVYYSRFITGTEPLESFIGGSNGGDRL